MRRTIEDMQRGILRARQAAELLNNPFFKSVISEISEEIGRKILAEDLQEERDLLYHRNKGVEFLIKHLKSIETEGKVCAELVERHQGPQKR